MTARARLLCVAAIVLAGAIGVISSTQTWLVVTLADAEHELTVAGAAAVPVLAPLSLAVLALGGALSIVGLVLRYIFGVLTVGIALVLGVLTAQIAFARPLDAAAPTVTDATGITGTAAISELVSGISATPWPICTLLAWVLLLAAGLFTIVTAHGWRGSDRRYRSDAVPPAGPAPSRPRDAVDSWDDLSRGDDPTVAPR